MYEMYAISKNGSGNGVDEETLPGATYALLTVVRLPAKRYCFILNLVICCLLFNQGLSAQVAGDKIYKNPAIDAVYSDVDLKIDAVILSDSGTSLQLTAIYSPGRRLNIPKETYISYEQDNPLDSPDTHKYFMSAVLGARTGNRNIMPDSGVLHYTLYFPLKLKQVKTGIKLHLGEDLPEGKQIYGIDYSWQDKPLSKELLGSWYDKGTGDLAYIIRPEVVIGAGGSIKSITGGHLKKGILYLTGKDGPRKLYYNLKDGALRVGNSPAALEKSAVYTKDQGLCHRLRAKDSYKGIQFKPDTSILKGYIAGFKDAGKGKKTIRFFVNDLVLGSQVSYVTEIQPDGLFEIKFPVYGPMQPLVRSDWLNKTLYLEPGKTLFVVLGAGPGPAFLGPLRGLNQDMEMLDKKLQVNWDIVVKQIGLKSPLAIKEEMLRQKSRLTGQLDAIYRSGEICTKAYEQKKLMIRYETATVLLYYEMAYERNYRHNRHLPDSAAVPPADIARSYYNFLTADLMDNPDLFQYSMGFLFLNYLKFRTPWLPLNRSLTVQGIYQTLAPKGVAFTPGELSVIESDREKNKPVDPARMEENRKKYMALFNRYGWEYRITDEAHVRDSIMKAYGISHGIANECMFAEDYASRVWSQLTPVDTGALRRMQMELTSPVLKTQMAVINNQVLDKLARSKNNTGYFVRNSAEIKADQIFDSIVSRYRGNILYIDFWATWCSPCRQAIAAIKPVKEQLAGKAVKFIYVTNESSPLDTWNNFIRDIKGEHFRLNQDQWNYLCHKFQVSGIPHVVLVDKKGQVMDPNYIAWGQDIRQKLEGLLQK